MSRSFQIDPKLLAIARVKLEDDPQALQSLVDTLQADTEQGAKLREHVVNIKARHAADILSGDDELVDSFILLVDTWKKIHPHLGESSESGSMLQPPQPAGLKNPVDDLSIYTLEKLSAWSGRTETEIMDDVQLGVLRASLITHGVDADDHTKRQILQTAGGEALTVIRSRIVWLTKVEAAELRRRGEVILSEADYPIFLDCIASPAVKRYRKERVIFTTPYTAKLSDLRFLDGDAIHYIAKHTGRELVRPDAVELLPKSKAGGSYVVYRLLAEGPSVEAELPQATEQQIASPASEEPAATAKPQYKGPLQDAAILDALSRLGLEPGSLPPQKRGREGPRAKVWEILKNNRSLFVSRDAFIHAWKRVMRQAKSMP